MIARSAVGETCVRRAGIKSGCAARASTTGSGVNRSHAQDCTASIFKPCRAAQVQTEVSDNLVLPDAIEHPCVTGVHARRKPPESSFFIGFDPSVRRVFHSDRPPRRTSTPCPQTSEFQCGAVLGLPRRGIVRRSVVSFSATAKFKQVRPPGVDGHHPVETIAAQIDEAAPVSDIRRQAVDHGFGVVFGMAAHDHTSVTGKQVGAPTVKVLRPPIPRIRNAIASSQSIR